MTDKKNIILAYSGHAYVIVEALKLKGVHNLFYCEDRIKDKNPFNLEYLGPENPGLLNSNNWIVGIGDNNIRAKIIEKNSLTNLITVVHPSAIISNSAIIEKGVFIAAGAIVNALARIGVGCIINSSSIVEHECVIGDFVHIAPGAVLAGNVIVGKRSFIGANTTIKDGVKIGNDVTVGAGSVVIKDVADGATVVGNPARIIK
ncbi:acetyltransferase [Saprospiraceae bacterium]|nr:acetyltransferase [Saprospiraceae bacterium]